MEYIINEERKTEEQIKKEATSIIHKAAIAAGATSGVMAQGAILALDTPVLIGIHIGMVVAIGAIFGKRVDHEGSVAIIGAAAGVGIGVAGVKGILGLMPGIGNVANASVSFGYTEGLGWFAFKYFKDTVAADATSNEITITGEKINMGHNIQEQHIGRDSIEIGGQAQINKSPIGGGDVFQGSHAQKLMESTTPTSSKGDIVNLLSFVQQELSKLSLPEEVKEEVIHEIKGAEIQAKKELPDKGKIATKLKNATEALQESAKTVKEAVTIGNLLGKAIAWCGEQWIQWML